ncbi:MAG: methyltransferase family protein [Candidatus Odinarchaeota archaeon]
MELPSIRAVFRLIGFAMILFFWQWIFNQQFELALELIIIICGVIAVFPVSYLGRVLLDRYSTTEHASWINTVIHFSIMICLGASIIRAFVTYDQWKGFIIPFPRGVSVLLVVVTGIFVMITVLYLALRGLGAPFALIVSSKYLVSDWLYARTRNPMVLAIILFLLSLGLWFQSAWFITWIIFLVFPAWIFFLKYYEERELEIRFGEKYLEYKANTPMFLPLSIEMLQQKREHGR